MLDTLATAPSLSEALWTQVGHGLPPFVMAGVAFYAGMHNLLFALRLPEKREYLHLSLICFAIAGYDIFSGLLYQSGSFAESLWYQRGQFSTSSLVVALFFLFLSKQFKLTYPPLIRFFFGIWWGFSVIAWFDSDLLLTVDRVAPKEYMFLGMHLRYLEVEPGPLLNLLYGTILVTIGWHFWQTLRQPEIKGGQSLRLVSAGLGIFFLAAINDILVGSGLLRTVYTLEYAFLAVMLMMDFHLATQFQSLYRKGERLNLELEGKVVDRMAEVHALASELQGKNYELQRINTRLMELTERDSLTGLYNNRAFQNRLEQAVNLARRQGLSLGVLMIDVDHFKQFNDRYGHQTGDEVLRVVSGILQRGVAELVAETSLDLSHVQPQTELRSYDIVGRYGGDEFAVVLFSCSIDGARKILDRIVEAARAVRFPSEPDMRITLSIGLDLRTTVTQETTAKRMVDQADQALYQAKAKGRDQYVLFEK
jgi:GGDEF domain-containing protein